MKNLSTIGALFVLFTGGLAGWAIGNAIFGKADECPKIYKQWDVLNEVILDCMEHPACYITPDTLMQVRTLAPQVAECERKEYDE